MSRILVAVDKMFYQSAFPVAEPVNHDAAHDVNCLKVDGVGNVCYDNADINYFRFTSDSTSPAVTGQRDIDSSGATLVLVT